MNMARWVLLAALALTGCQSKEDRLRELRVSEASVEVRLAALERDGGAQDCQSVPGRCISVREYRDSLRVLRMKMDDLRR